MSASREITLQEKIDRLRAALERSVKFIRLGNHPNAGDLLDQIDAALANEQENNNA